MLEFEDYTFGFDKLSWRLNYRFSSRTVCQILGSNGSGKSTIAKAIVGILPSCRGKGLFLGKSIADMSPSEKRKHFFLVPQQPLWSFVGDTLLDHLKWLAPMLNQDMRTDSLDIIRSESASIYDLCQAPLVELDPERLVIAALVEDIVLPRPIMVLDECPDFEVPEHEKFFLNWTFARSREGKVTILTRHVHLSMMSSHAHFQSISAADMVCQ